VNDRQSTRAADLLRVLEERTADALGRRLLGLYLTGSLVTGDFDERVSDIDLVAVLPDEPRAEDLARLGVMHDRIAREHPEWDDRVEVIYIGADALATFRTRASTIGAISPGEPFHTKAAGIDWLINWYLIQRYGRVLRGPPFAEFAPAIGDEEFVDSARSLAHLMRPGLDETTTTRSRAYYLITLCRALVTVTTGRMPSKAYALAWTRERVPDWVGLLDRCAAIWRGDLDGPVEKVLPLPEAQRCADEILARLR